MHEANHLRRPPADLHGGFAGERVTDGRRAGMRGARSRRGREGDGRVRSRLAGGGC
ncbi:MAG TPA: hypothetical protein PKK68_11705 [Methanothrix soehngenii]|nr:hypothetical protein [Methanothrix soehngenii]